MDLICFSHLRWDYVYQRPRHLMKRAAKNFRVYYFEEPVLSPNPDGYAKKSTEEDVYIITPNLKEDLPVGIAKRMENIFRSFMAEEHINNYIFWYYTPGMFSFSESFNPQLIIYDCMDNLNSVIKSNELLASAEKH